jgi:hypothetical protein
MLERRTFMLSLAAGAAALLGGCGHSGQAITGDASGSAESVDAYTGPNRAPVWQQVPTIVFVQGVASSVSVAEFVSDPDGDPLAITKNAAALPAGVTYDAAGKQLVYDGVGDLASTDGHVLTADDDRP